jgi:integrase|tara:strand:- start:136 stop:1692 length:1557 start_codon:yes stop_codon:yes gene_type:complete
MTKRQNNDKLGHALAKIEFTNKAIEDFKSDKDCRIPFNTIGSTLKGLGFRYSHRTNKKTFALNIWFKKRTITMVWEYKKAIFGCDEMEDKMFSFKRHKDSNGRWIRDPNEELMTEGAIMHSQKMTIRKVIERICEDNFPRAKLTGKIACNSQIVYSRFLLGYNHRRDHLNFSDDENGWGKITFKTNSKIQNWKQLFKEYPQRIGLIKDGSLNPDCEVSLYDDPLGSLIIDELTPGVITRYLHQKNRTYGQKNNMLKALQCLWGYARRKNLMGDNPPLDPTRRQYGGVSIVKDEVSNFEGSKYNETSFTIAELNQIHFALYSLRRKYPFQAEVLLFMLCTGKRLIETLKITWAMITDHEIILDRTITKGRKKEIVDITKPVRKVLNSLERQLKRRNTKLQSRVKWLFPTMRINKKKLIDEVKYPNYINSHYTRTKTVRDVWALALKQVGLEGAPKSLRKSFSTKVVEVLGSASKGKALTHHLSEEILSGKYDKTPPSVRKAYAEEVSQHFEFKKNTTLN